MYAAMALFWIVYAITGCCAPGSSYINNVVNVKQVFKNIEAAIEARPICTMTIQNYHYEERVRTTTDKDGNE